MMPYPSLIPYVWYPIDVRPEDAMTTRHKVARRCPQPEPPAIPSDSGFKAKTRRIAIILAQVFTGRLRHARTASTSR